MKYCRDCKYCTLRGICVSPLNPVTGEPQQTLPEVSRSANIGSCGPDAKNFEPREVESSL